jgi:predicted GIY-YIG superfamily endonuclease
MLLAAPAGVAIWSGWVGLGGLAGFGVVHPLPGIADGVQLNTAITLPVGMEAYAAYALRAWLAGDGPARARRFARWSAIAALSLGAAGQVTYHLMAAAGMVRAPWPVTIAVACVPVGVLGMGAALAHLLRADEPVSPAVGEREPVGVEEVPAEPSEPYAPEIPSRPEGSVAVVYRLYDGEGSLLYVGCTVDPATRLRAHRRRQPWWDEVVSSEVVWYSSMDQAADVEQHAILAERPVYNVCIGRYTGGGWLAGPKGSPVADESGEGRALTLVAPRSRVRKHRAAGRGSSQRLPCDCGCGGRVSKATRTRHRAARRAAGAGGL